MNFCPTWCLNFTLFYILVLVHEALQTIMCLLYNLWLFPCIQLWNTPLKMNKAQSIVYICSCVTVLWFIAIWLRNLTSYNMVLCPGQDTQRTRTGFCSPLFWINLVLFRIRIRICVNYKQLQTSCFTPFITDGKNIPLHMLKKKNILFTLSTFTVHY